MFALNVCDSPHKTILRFSNNRIILESKHMGLLYAKRQILQFYMT